MTLPSALEGHAVLLVVDGIGYLLPAIRPDMPPRLRRLLGLRREATIKGRCPAARRPRPEVPRWRRVSVS